VDVFGDTTLTHEQRVADVHPRGFVVLTTVVQIGGPYAVCGNITVRCNYQELNTIAGYDTGFSDEWRAGLL
jgi:hypothetical protein